MASRVARSAAALLLCASVAGGAAHGAQPDSKSPLEATRAGATVTVALFRALDDATVEAYVLETLMGGVETIGATQACATADNRVSQRPSALANPPSSEASILQRERLIQTLGTYGFVTVLLSRRATMPELAVALANLQRGAFTLDAIAKVHTPSDLFIDDRANSLLTLAKRLRSAKDRTTVRKLIDKGRPTMAKLVMVLRDDVSRRQHEAVGAARLEVALWHAYGVAGLRGGPPQQPSLPLCDGPVATYPDPQTQSVPITSNMPETIRSGLKRAQARVAALQSVNLNPFFTALFDLTATSSGSPAAIAASLRQLDAAMVTPEKNARPLFNGSTQ